jgi:hypothetical protein
MNLIRNSNAGIFLLYGRRFACQTDGLKILVRGINPPNKPGRLWVFTQNALGHWRRRERVHLLFVVWQPEFSRYLERGIVNNLRRGTGKSRQGEMAVLCPGREP